MDESKEEYTSEVTESDPEITNKQVPNTDEETKANSEEDSP